jgi:hypothetical protein
VLLAYVTGMVNQELLLQNEYLAADFNGDGIAGAAVVANGIATLLGNAGGFAAPKRLLPASLHLLSQPETSMGMAKPIWPLRAREVS